MKKLSLLMLTTLILGCGTETPVVEEPEPVIEGLNKHLAEIRAVADQLSQAAESLDYSVPTITESSVVDGAANVDSKPLNLEGIHITFSERIALSHFHLLHEEGYSLDWTTEWHPDGQTVTLTASNPCAILRDGHTYVIDFVVQDFDSWKTEDTITFTTEPAGPAAPAIDFNPVHIERININTWTDTGDRVDAEQVNQHGITIVFDRDIALSNFDLTLIAPNHDLEMIDHFDWSPHLADGLSLSWIAKWSNLRTVTLRAPPIACSMLQKGATYHLDIDIVAFHCFTWDSKSFTFFTKAE